MNIAFFTDTYYPDLNGVSVSVDNLAKALRKKGHKVYIFAPDVKKDFKDTDKDLIRFPSLRLLSNVEPQIYFPTIVLNKQFKALFDKDFDIVHAHGNGPYSFIGYLAAKYKKVPFVMTFHTIHTYYTHYIFGGKILKPKMVEIFFKLFAQRCKAVFVPSEKMKDELISYGVKKQIYVSPNFLDFNKFKNVKKGFLHKQLNLSDSAQIILTVVRIGKEKNIDFMLKTFQKVYRENENAHFVIVGQGPERKNLEKICQDLQISDRVHFTGKIDYKFMPQVYKDANVFIFSSITETQGVGVLEAIASGIPIVINNDTAYKNMIKNSKNGYSLSLEDNKFAEKILYLLENQTVSEKMGKMSEEIAKKNFSEEKIIDDLENKYSSILNL